MADPYHHALSSVKKWGGVAEDYLAIHQWFDESKGYYSDPRHRALRHHAEGIEMCRKILGPTVMTSTGAAIPTRWVAEQHVLEDMGRIPTVEEWLSCIQPQPWMNKPVKIEKTLQL